MNQDKVKEILLSLRDSSLEFSVTFTGKESKKVNGLYKPDTKEILIHNKNFKNDNQLVYTAIHEYAHHLECEKNGGKSSGGRCHTNSFWACFHSLLEEAEKKGIYTIGYKEFPELEALTEKIRNDYLKKNGVLMKEFGALLMEARELCLKYNVRYEDYIDRVLQLPRNSAKAAARVSAVNVTPDVGYENMKILAAIKDPEKRKNAEECFTKEGKSPDEVKAVFKPLPKEDPLSRMLKEKKRIENTIAKLKNRLEEIENTLSRETSN